ncbi:hypothetical protein GHK58_28800 [Sinorhizobium meliloti]|uniref:hypothetical protein n=1 Tax=Rhizobium meliloti TaxID=382 RepID=UPI001295165A|nr:hypothetical protein [Sinorhizobium meliloti]MQX44079.1 hypothetical protein [Sinorhizobium meliloti]
MYKQKLDPIKLSLIDRAITLAPEIKSSADLGACWGVDGGYSRYVLEEHKLEKAVIVDQHITSATQEWTSHQPKAKPVTGLFGTDSTLEKVGDVDVVFFFDVLLHQVAPDWNEVLKMWAPKTKYFLIHNPMWTVGSETLRFPDYGFEWFKANVVYQHEGRLKEWFANLDKFDLEQNKPLKDVHNFWQFGITHQDMITTLDRLGFDCVFSKYLKSRSTKPWIKNYGYLFKKR